MDYTAFVRSQLAQDETMSATMLEQIYRNLDGRAYDADDLEYTGEQLIDRALMQAAEYFDIAGNPDYVRREIAAMLTPTAPVPGAD